MGVLLSIFVELCDEIFLIYQYFDDRIIMLNYFFITIKFSLDFYSIFLFLVFIIIKKEIFKERSDDYSKITRPKK